MTSHRWIVAQGEVSCNGLYQFFGISAFRAWARLDRRPKTLVLTPQSRLQGTQGFVLSVFICCRASVFLCKQPLAPLTADGRPLDQPTTPAEQTTS